MVAGKARPDDWPQWRGPNRDGVWRETGILEAIPPSGLPVKWRVEIGQGYSGPVVARGRVFMNDRLLDPEEVDDVAVSMPPVEKQSGPIPTPPITARWNTGMVREPLPPSMTAR